MKTLCLALTMAVGVMLTSPAAAGSGQHNYRYGPSAQKNAPLYQNRKAKDVQRRDRGQDLRALQIRRECRMFAFKYWRYHPDYQHCRYY